MKRGILGSVARLFLACPIALWVLTSPGIPSAAAETRTVSVGVYENPPKIFTSESGKPAGIFIDLIEPIAESEGWHLRYVPGTWVEGLDRLAKGEIDLMPDVAHTPERAKLFSFHREPALSSWFQVYARKGTGIRSILDLGGKRIAVLDRSVQQDVFAELMDGFKLNTTVISVPDYKTVFESVARGEADAAITNRFYGIMHAQQQGLEDTKVVFHPTFFFLAAAKTGSEDLLDTLDKHLLKMKSNPESAYYGSLKQ